MKLQLQERKAINKQNIEPISTWTNDICDSSSENINYTTVNSLFKRKLSSFDVIVETILKNEIIRQDTSLNLITSENLASSDILEAQNNVFINKYSKEDPRILIL